MTCRSVRIFGRALTVTREPYVSTSAAGKRQSYVDVRCSCGTVKAIQAASLRRGTTKSCGCLNREQITERGRERFRALTGELSPHWKGEDGRTSKAAWLTAEKDSPCVDCGQRFPKHVMQFDHRPEFTKSFMINGNAVTSKRTLAELKAERAKCDLVCSNCHDHRTWMRACGLEVIPLLVYMAAQQAARPEVELAA